MTTFGAGQICHWEGGSLWIGRAIAVNAVHTSNHPHAFDGRKAPALAHIFVEPVSTAGRVPLRLQGLLKAGLPGARRSPESPRVMMAASIPSARRGGQS